MMEIVIKESDFFKYCPKCKHEKVDEHEEPCESCMDSFFNYHTNRPVNFEPKEKRRSRFGKKDS